MEQEVFNFARYYVALSRMIFSSSEDKQEYTRMIVKKATCGRTDDLKYVTRGEYASLCSSLEKTLGTDRKFREERALREILRRWRSVVLHQLQSMGIDTANWGAVDAYCKNPRIAGKRFCRLSEDELEKLSLKLRMIEKKNN